MDKTEKLLVKILEAWDLTDGYQISNGMDAALQEADNHISTLLIDRKKNN